MEKASFGGPTHWIQVAKLCADFMDRLAPALAPCRAPRTNKGQTSESAGIGNQCVFLGLYKYIYIYICIICIYIYMDLEWSESFLVVVFASLQSWYWEWFIFHQFLGASLIPPKTYVKLGSVVNPPKNQTRTRKHKQKLKFTATIPSRFDTKHL